MKVKYPRPITILLLSSLIYLFTLIACKTIKPGNMDFSTVQQLDLERYMGKWYEIARYPNRFERDLVGVTAHYELRPDGKINVTNAGYKNSFDGEYKEVNGKAKQPDPSDPGKLRVSFFLFFYSDYYIFEIGDDYEWALVGSSTDEYLWLLSRTPSPGKKTVSRILDEARRRGFDTSRLIWVEQKE